MKKRIKEIFILIILCLLFYYYGKPFSETMMLKFQNKKTVNEVLNDLELTIKKNYPDIDELTDGKQITILVFKDEQVLEVWKNKNNKHVFIKSFVFTASSGKPGPKLKENDRQIPEGIYKIEYLNPNSKYHLSLKINYPNEFDKKMAKKDKRKFLGGDVFIHGSDKTIGCIPIGDEAIEELFYLIAKNGYLNTKVIISPYDMRVREIAINNTYIDWGDKLYSIIKKCLIDFNRKNG